MLLWPLIPVIVAGAKLRDAATISGVVHLANGRPAALAVVFLEGAVKSKPLRRVVIDQRDKTFIPHVSVVTLNTVVDFPNNDVIYHNVFTEYHSQRFDLGMYPRGAVRHQKFDRTGLAVLLCNIHPDMAAFVMCVDTPFYAITDRAGRFKIPNVPAGDYVARAWHESGGTWTQRTTVESDENLVAIVHR